jgi:hypothetical protein
MPFQSRRDRNRFGSIDRMPMCDWHDSNHDSAFDDLLRGNNGTRTILISFFLSLAVFGCLQMRP